MKTNFAPFVTLDDPDSAEPLYRQIYDRFREAILDGLVPPGTRLPATRMLAGELGVSRMTVVNAYDQLLAEGYLEGRTGSGTFVASQLPEEFLLVPRETAGARGVRERRSIPLSGYGGNVRNSSAQIAANHSATPAVPFQHSLISVGDFPFDLWSKIAQRQIKYSYKTLGGYGDAAGYGPLRRAIADHLRSTRGVRCEDEQILVTSGTQQAVFLTATLLISAGERVWLEDPCHLGTSDVMSAVGADVSRIRVDEEGFDLARAVRTGRPARLVYVTPSRQYPLGITMTLQRRLNLLEWAKENEAWIIEDDYDSEFRYSGRPLPSLQGLDPASRVLYVGTFSKTVFPGLRLGGIVLPPDLVDTFTAARALNDLHAPVTDQMILAEFIADGHFERHVRRMRALYRNRREVLLGELERHFRGLFEISGSEAGMHVVAWLPKGVNDLEVSQKASAAGIRAAPVSRYAIESLGRGALMLGFTAFKEKDIQRACKRLAEAIL